MYNLLGWWSRDTAQDDNHKPAQLKDEIILTGKDSTECEEWIRSIQREAFAQGKTVDKIWMAALASTRITGRALRWYSKQSDEVTSDWTQLRAAILDEYCAEPVQPSTPNLCLIPTPSAAPPLDLGGDWWLPPASSVPWNPETVPPPSLPAYISGHIKVHCEVPSRMSTTIYTGYLYADYKTGAVFVDSEPCSAQRLVIRLGPNGVTDGIQVVPPIEFMDVKLYLYWASLRADMLDIDSTEDAWYQYAQLALSKPASHKSSKLIAATVLHDGRISISGCHTGDSIAPLRALINESKLILTETPDKYRYLGKNLWVDAELFFEPVE
ncbi:hypothetical protein FRC04_007438 [Tulasnella sp. 424]|nr:hypothetical protein FRC04_007438 [Tulasnella sp. 424]KAG8975133.1 hypothetical protein FRC05_006301 [Tulasnella sp. 425]